MLSFHGFFFKRAQPEKNIPQPKRLKKKMPRHLPVSLISAVVDFCSTKRDRIIEKIYLSLDRCAPCDFFSETTKKKKTALKKIRNWKEVKHSVFFCREELEESCETKNGEAYVFCMCMLKGHLRWLEIYTFCKAFGRWKDWILKGWRLESEWLSMWIQKSTMNQNMLLLVEQGW